MAVIAEELILYDKFTNTFNRYIHQAQKGTEATEGFKKKVQQTENATSSLTNKILSLGKAYLSLKGAQQIFNISDTLSQTGARLDMINEKYKTTLNLQNMIMQSAINSRGAYADTADLVAKLGTLASSAFKNPEEIVAFAEQINKQFVLAGTSATGAQAAMLQLTQALSSGTLRGEELNSVLENAPTIAQAISNYLGVTTGEMRNLAAEGKITADVVKAAMFAAADETNAKFAQMPYTYAQVGTLLVNTVQKTFEPILQIVGQGANAIGENIENLIPVFYGVGAAIGFFSAASALAKLNFEALTAAMLSNPIGWVALAIGVVVMAMYKWVQTMGSAKVAWMSFKNTFTTAMESMALGLVKFGYKITSTIRGMKTNIIGAFTDLVNFMIDGINKMISLVNKIPGVAIDTLDNVNWAANVAVEAQVKNAQDLAYIKELEDQFRYNKLVREQEIQAAKTEAAANSENYSFDYNAAIADGVGNIDANTGDIKKAVSASNEDLKMLVDVATRRFVNNVNLTTQAPVINVTGQNTGDKEADRKAFADKLASILLEQASASSLGTTATIF